MKKQHWIKLFTFKYSFDDIIEYFRANIRYTLYYSNFKWLIPPHILEQIDFRINVMMDKQCYTDGSCKVCGCTTTNLQMTNSSCAGDCYPALQCKCKWDRFKKKGIIIEDKYIWINTKAMTSVCDPTIKKYIKKQENVG